MLPFPAIFVLTRTPSPSLTLSWTLYNYLLSSWALFITFRWKTVVSQWAILSLSNADTAFGITQPHSYYRLVTKKNPQTHRNSFDLVSGGTEKVRLSNIYDQLTDVFHLKIHWNEVQLCFVQVNSVILCCVHKLAFMLITNWTPNELQQVQSDMQQYRLVFSRGHARFLCKLNLQNQSQSYSQQLRTVLIIWYC